MNGKKKKKKSAGVVKPVFYLIIIAYFAKSGKEKYNQLSLNYFNILSISGVLRS